jgi:hypothetical protein
MKFSPLAAALALAWASSAAADEPIKTAGAGAPPPAVEATAIAAPQAAPTSDKSAQAIGDWARGVLAGAPAADAAKPDRPRCAAPPDRKPHGEVWAGIGTHGYREVGGVVTQPIGDCGSVTIAVSHSEADFGRGHGRR